MCLSKAKALLYIVVLVLLTIVPMACDNVTCPLENTVACEYGFYASARDDNGELIPGMAVSVGDTLTVTAIGPDTILMNRLVGASSMSLPVSYYNDVDVLEFAYVDAQGRTAADTLWMSKRNQHHFDDPSCPIHIWHTILGVRSTHHLIDTVVIASPDINYDGLENLQVYYFTSTSTHDEI